MGVHFSSASNEWATPMDFFEKLNGYFGFTLDPCCTPDTAKAKKYFTQAEDGLKQDWSDDVVFMNPPYGRAIGIWVKKAYEESVRGALVACLIPSRTDTAWWHDYCMQGEILFLRGRLTFVQAGKTAPAPFPSAVVLFCPDKYRDGMADLLKKFGGEWNKRVDKKRKTRKMVA